MGRDVGTHKDLAEGRIFLEVALKNKCSVIDSKINRWWQFLFHRLYDGSTEVWHFVSKIVLT